jgi:hypothetical protein
MKQHPRYVSSNDTLVPNQQTILSPPVDFLVDITACDTDNTSDTVMVDRTNANGYDE